MGTWPEDQVAPSVRSIIAPGDGPIESDRAISCTMELDASARPGWTSTLGDVLERRKWLWSVGLLGIAPALFSLELIAIAASSNGFAGDFRMELDPEAQKVVHGINPFPPSDSPFPYHSQIWPIPAAIAVSPLTLLSAPAAAAIFSLLGVAALVASLRLLGVRDWRVYGFVGVWPATVSGFQAGNVTPLLALLLAVAWKYRERVVVPGLAIGAAVANNRSFYNDEVHQERVARLRGRPIENKWIGQRISDPDIDIAGLARAQGAQGFGPIGFLSQAGVPWSVAQVLGYGVGLASLFAAWRRRSFVLGIAASLLISPIVWLHYFTLLVVPLAIRSNSLDWLWVTPLAMWCCTSATHGSVVWQTGVALACFGLVVAASEMSPPRRASRAASAFA